MSCLFYAVKIYILDVFSVFTGKSLPSISNPYNGTYARGQSKPRRTTSRIKHINIISAALPGESEGIHVIIFNVILLRKYHSTTGRYIPHFLFIFIHTYHN